MAAYAPDVYSGDGATVTFNITFDYISTDHVKVEVDGVAETGLTFPSASQVTLTSAPATGSNNVVVFRQTKRDGRLIDFEDGSSMTEANLDKDSRQNYFIAQEVLYDFDDRLPRHSDTTNWDAGSARIRNVTDPTDDQDVATKAYVASKTASSVAAAAASAAAAAASETNASTSETNAGTSASAASISATNAATSASEAASSAASVNMESPTSGDAGKLVKVNAAEDGFAIIDAVSINSNDQLVGVADPTSGSHVGDRDFNDARYLTLSGGTMTGGIDMGGSDITNVRRIEDADSDTYVAVESSSDLDKVQVGCEGNVVATFGADVPLTTTHPNASDRIALLQATHASYAGQGLKVQTTRAGHAGFNLAMLVSNNDADVEFRFTGDGNGQCDGSWTGGGAGYAEAFEWADGNPDGEDRVGITVVIVPDTDMIRPARQGEDPDGVITGRPTVVGRSAPMRWDGKYRRDDYGRPVLDENGERIRNPNFDETRVYTPRLQRKEWDLVSLLGLEPVRDGQPVSGRWTRAGKGAGVTRYIVR